jgi:putative ABC transport system permease protein
MSSFRRKLQVLKLYETQGDETGAQESLLLLKRLMQAVRSSHDLIAPEALLAELHYSVRMLRRNPGFAALVILTLALGIGMTTAMFSVVNGVLLKPLPYPDADRLVWIAPHADWGDASISRADYLLWKHQAHSFDGFAAYGNDDRALVYQKKPITLQVAYITGDFWSISGAKPVLGRLFAEDERDQLVLSWPLFQERFGADPQAIGKTVTIDGRSFTIVGVLPRSFRFLLPPEIFAGDPIPEIGAYIPIPQGREAPGDPIRETAETGPVPTWVRVVGRLKSGVPFSRARAEMQVIYDRVRQIPNVFGRWPEEKMRFIPLSEKITGEQRTPVILLFGAVGFVLLIAGANFANLLMARASTRQREIAVRSALGASRNHLVRQFLVESILLAILGGAAGLLIARWAVDIAIHIGAHAVPRLADVGIDTRVLLFTLILSFTTGIVFGLAPVFGLRWRNVNERLKSEGATSSAGGGQLRFRTVLVTAEFALAILLLAGAGLLLKSFWRMNDFPPGFNPKKLLVVNVSMGGPKYFRHWPQQDAYIQSLSSRIGQLPGVEAFGLDCGTFFQSLETVGAVPHEKGKDTFAVRYVSTGFFRTVRAPLIQGRWPTDAEWRDFKDLVLVNQTFARMYSGGGSIVGKHIVGGLVDASVVGVVADFKEFQLDATPEPQVYVYYPLAPGMLNMKVFLRTEKPSLIEATLPQLTSAIDPDVPVRVDMLDQALAESITSRRFNMYIFEVFAGSALLLAAIGIYGVLAYLVKQRTREIGIRMALGAERQAIVRLVLARGMRVALTGTALGIAAALGLARVMASLLYDTSPTDPVTLLCVSTILGLAALAACSQPAFLASRTDPIVALRHE